MRALVIAAVALLGLLLGAALDLLWAAATEGPTLPILTVAGGLVGLLAGWVLARLTMPRPRPPLDPARYPNRVIRRV